MEEDETPSTQENEEREREVTAKEEREIEGL
jgi:hypothetical protein